MNHEGFVYQNARPRRVISYKTRGLWSHQKRAFLTPISCYDKRTSKTRVFGDSKARVKNARFYRRSHVEEVLLSNRMLLTCQCAIRRPSRRL